MAKKTTKVGTGTSKNVKKKFSSGNRKAKKASGLKSKVKKPKFLKRSQNK